MSSPSRICSVKFFDPTTTAFVRRPVSASETPAKATSRSAPAASAVDGTAPARMTVASTIDRPRKMYSPSPPAPIAAAIVAVPTPTTVATRMPASIEGQASGSSISRSSSHGRMPMASAASRTAGSIP
jgi:hypothetical protein